MKKPQDELFHEVLDYSGWECSRDGDAIDIFDPFPGRARVELDRARIVLAIMRSHTKVPHHFRDDVMVYERKTMRHAYGVKELQVCQGRGEYIEPVLEQASRKLAVNPKRDLTYWRLNPNRRYNDYFASDIHAFEYHEQRDVLVPRCSEGPEVVLTDEHPAWPPRNRRCPRCREQDFIEYYETNWKHLIDCVDTRQSSTGTEYPQY